MARPGQPIHYTRNRNKPARVEHLFEGPKTSGPLAGLNRQVYIRTGSPRLLEFDFSRPLSVKEREAFTSRQRRLSGALGRSAGEAMEALNDVGSPPGALVIRNSFSYLYEPVDESLVSDRRAPHRSLRPSATRISSSQGVALRLYLAALAVAQAHTRPGDRARPDITLQKAGLGWSDLVATKAETRGSGRAMINYRDKKKQSVRTALRALQNGTICTPGPNRSHAAWWGGRCCGDEQRSC